MMISTAWRTSTGGEHHTPHVGFRGAKMLTLEEVISEQLEAEGHVLAEKVAEHMLLCF
jgi:hypothetical protein